MQPDPDASSPCDGMSCPAPDLVVVLPTEALALSFRTVDITEDDCELFEGCVGGLGKRSLIELSFTLRNTGDAPLELGRPFENPLYYPSFCQDSYVIDGFFAAELRDEDGDIVASGRLSTSCIAGDDGAYTCRAQGLAPEEGSAQPIGRCDYLDVTGLGEGDYTLVVTANADHAITESDFDNNSSELTFHYSPCDGTVCGGACCPSGVACVQDTCMLPDLRINEEAAAESIWITHQAFGTDSCELSEMCANGSGRRRLLQFEGRIENWGPGDLNPGREAGNPLYEYSECHEHYHFLDFTDYRLVNEDGTVAALGHKQSFCLVDMIQVEGATGPAPIGTRPPPGETGCSYLSAGWADIYGVGTPCQWVDITDVAAGDYVLELTVNPEDKVLETNTDNNLVQIQVHVSEDVPCVPQQEICGDNIDQDCDDQPDSYDPDCYACSPYDPDCEESIEVSGNDSCSGAYEMTEQASFEAFIESDDDGEVTPSCGGEGGDLFFAFSLEDEQAVYLGTLGSNVDTVLALYANDCNGQQLACEDDACRGSASQIVSILPAGNYMVAVKAKDAGDAGRVRLKFQHAAAQGAMVLDAPGVYAGDTSVADDSIQACGYQGYPGDEDGGVEEGVGSADGGVAPSEEACVHLAEANAGSAADHECLHCACGYDPIGVSECGEAGWDLIGCVIDECDGDGTNVSCITNACSAYLGGLSDAQAAAAAMQQCPESCELDTGSGMSGGGTAGAGGSTAGTSGAGMGGMGGSIDGGVSNPLEPAPDDIYVIATCQQGVIASTCGTAMFDSVIDIRSGSLTNFSQGCSADYDVCQGATLGSAVNAYTPAGLTFIVVDGRNASASGEYQMSLIY